VLSAAALLVTGCSGGKPAQPEALVKVQTAIVRRGVIKQMVNAEAVLYPIAQAPIVPKITAPIRKFYVERGSRVHAGELLAVLENRDLAAAVTESLGAYEQAQAEYATSVQEILPVQIQTAELNVKAAQHAMAASRQVYESREKLFKAGALSRNLLNQSYVAYIQAHNQYQIAVSELKGLQSIGKEQQIKSAKAQMTAAEGRYEAALAELQYSEIRSPIAGVVASRPLYEGEMASAGAPVVTVMNISKVVARAHVTPQQAALLRLGDPAFISLGSEKDVQGRVTVVSPALDPSSTTVQVWVEAANPGDALKPGATVDVTMVAKAVRDALTIPASAIVTGDDGKTSVMAVGAGDVAHQRAVTLGIHQGQRVQVTTGLSPGERVVTEGAFGLPDGTKVEY
jgi:HlyD family secretion protein